MTNTIDGTRPNDPTPSQTILSSPPDIEAQYAVYTRISRELLLKNKEVLFDALADAGITVVVVTFDGASDEGQIESIEAKSGDDPVEFPDVKILLQRAVMDAFSKPNVVALTETFPEALEAIANDYLGEAQDGWENGEGAYGDFTFDVQSRTVTLDFNERFIDSENSTFEF